MEHANLHFVQAILFRKNYTACHVTFTSSDNVGSGESLKVWWLEGVLIANSQKSTRKALCSTKIKSWSRSQYWALTPRSARKFPPKGLFANFAKEKMHLPGCCWTWSMEEANMDQTSFPLLRSILSMWRMSRKTQPTSGQNPTNRFQVKMKLKSKLSKWLEKLKRLRPPNFDLHQLVKDDRMNELQKLFGYCCASALHKRGNSIFFLHVHFALSLFLFKQSTIFKCSKHLEKKNLPALTFWFLEALNSCCLAFRAMLWSQLGNLKNCEPLTVLLCRLDTLLQIYSII